MPGQAASRPCLKQLQQHAWIAGQKPRGHNATFSNCLSLNFCLNFAQVQIQDQVQFSKLLRQTLRTTELLTWVFQCTANGELQSDFLQVFQKTVQTRSQAVARIADRTAKNCKGHVTQATPSFRDIYLRACSALPIQSHVSNLKFLAQAVLKICSIVCQNLQGSRDLGQAHFQGKLFVRPLGISDTKLHTKFEVSSSSNFRDIAL